MKSNLKFISYAALLVNLVAGAQAQEPAPLAHGDVPGEPHHHLKIENEYDRVYYVEVSPHEDTQLHQHDHDYIYVSLGASDVVNAVLNKPEIHLQLKDGETHFTRGGFAHVARNFADTPFRNITIELLKPQGEAHNVCGTIIAVEIVTMCEPAPGPVAAMTLFETAEVSLANVALLPNGKHKETDSKCAFLLIGVSGTDVKINPKRKSPKVLREGEAEWFESGSDLEFSNEGANVTSFLQLTFKDSAKQTSGQRPKT